MSRGLLFPDTVYIIIGLPADDSLGAGGVVAVDRLPVIS